MREAKIFLLFLIMVFLKGAVSEVHTVGDELEWNTGANFGSWSQKYNFSVGDTLVFKYVKGQHNVYEVIEATYRSCNASTGVLATYESGNDQIELKKAKKYWFICNIAGHCLGGMRFFIDVKEANSTNTRPTTPQSEPIPPPPPANSCAAIYVFDGWSFWVSLVPFGVLLQL
uniref:Phytocyanin domain-containing protein n=1 Tax=Populus davidiana TaxID=266767 RepID=A0A6M2EKR4_9ROSI